MPTYLYKNPKTEETLEITQGVNDKHEYIDSDGLKYERVFTAPTMSVDTSGSSNEKDFARKTASKKDSIGDLWDRSKEESQKREKVFGKDPVKEKYLSDYSATRKGKVLPKDLQK
jgi:predicted nucleic acid-binding Zn ribbon protein